MGESVRILYVDADEATRDRGRSGLEGADERFVVETAANASEVLDRVGMGGIDCVVAEYELPDRNGIELFRAVRAEHLDLPFVLFTDAGSEGVATDALSAGVSDYVQKTAGDDDYAVLAHRISTLMGRSRTNAESEAFRRQLLRIGADRELSDDEKIQRLLELGCDRFDVENGHLVMIDDVTGRHEVVAVHGSDVVRKGVTELSDSYCRRTIESDAIVDVHHAAEQGWGEDPAYERFGLECYIGGKLTVEGQLYGTVCFVDEAPRGPFTRDETAFFDLLLRWFSQLVERRRRLRVAETVFQQSHDGLFLVDVRDGPAFGIRSVNRTYDELTGVSTDNVAGTTIQDLVGEEAAARIERRYRACVDRSAPIEYDDHLALDGTTRPWPTRLAPVLEGETVVQLVGSTHGPVDRPARREREQSTE
jgi:PAS domain S-box-containing protein